MPADENLTADFRQFISAAQGILPRRPAEDLDRRFREFVDKATPILLGDVPERLAEVQERIDTIRTWIPSTDLLAIAGIYLEDSYTELVAWALAPSTHPDTALTRQRAWLDWLGIDTNDISEPVEPKTQIRTDDGIPDLVLLYPTRSVVVEVKTDSMEHEAPSGQLQTFAYPEAVRRHFDIDEKLPMTTVFLTRSGDQPASPRAIPTTFLDFVLALMRGLAPEDLPTETRVSLGMVFRNLLAAMAPDHTDVLQEIAELEQGTARARESQHAFPISKIHQLEELHSLIVRKAER